MIFYKKLICIYILSTLTIAFTVLHAYGKQTESDTNNARVTQSPATGFTGSMSCQKCHNSEYTQWMTSHHQLAMQKANDQSVLGSFSNSQFNYSNSQFNYRGITSRFYRKGDRFFVETDGPEGKLAEYEIIYTFGVTPLQQYLVKLDNGRLQALSIAWDSRTKSAGGQRWYHLYNDDYPDDNINSSHPLHWTKTSQNWNYVCADCHSTQLKRKFSENQYHTTWSEINVACEACHGPGKNHILWADSGGKSSISRKGLSIQFTERQGVSWIMDSLTGNAKRSQENKNRTEIEVCGRCHSRRTPLTDGNLEADAVSQKLLDRYRLQLLTENNYHPDGQPKDETYVYGSFLQSKMHQAGVTCSDCHNPHSLKPRQTGNGVCLQCHSTEKFNSSTHHFHSTLTSGGQCMECHAPAQHYMTVDRRHDHSFRIPRPDLSITTGTPNACNNCHKDKDAQWAAGHIRKWYGTDHKSGHQVYAEPFFNARKGHPAAGRHLQELAVDNSIPDIARGNSSG